MRTHKLIAIAMVGIFLTAPIIASERVNIEKLKVRALPTETYAKFSKGKKLSQIWKDSKFDSAKGFKPGEIEWKAENRIGEVSSYLKEQLSAIGSKEGIYSLDLFVTEAQAGDLGYTWNKTGFFILEGRVKDSDGTVIAAFITKEEDEFAGFGKSLKPGVDRAISGIVSELFKK